MRKLPTLQEMQQMEKEFAHRGCGVILRDGTWCYCAYGAHEDLLDELGLTDVKGTVVIFSSYQDYALQPRTWGLLLEGALEDDSLVLTAAQEETIKRLVDESTDKAYRIELLEGLETYRLRKIRLRLEAEEQTTTTEDTK